MKELDPRSKLLMVICISTLAIVYQDPLRLMYLTFFTLMVFFLVTPDFKTGLRPLEKILPLMLVLFLVQCLFTWKGRPLLTVQGIRIVTDLGLTMGVVVVLRIMVIILAGMILLSSSERDFLLALVQWKVPYEIAFMVMVGLHFIPILREEALNVYYAVQMRGTELTGSLCKQKLKLYTSIMLPIISGAVSRAEQMAIAMEARAFRAYPQRSYMRKLQLKKIDYVVQITVVLGSIILLICR
jgi:energy-coupling factor transport system permease protein